MGDTNVSRRVRLWASVGSGGGMDRKPQVYCPKRELEGRYGGASTNTSRMSLLLIARHVGVS